MNISYINHKNKRIIYVDYRGCKCEDDLLLVINKLKEHYERTTENHILLNDFTGAFGTRNFMKHANKLGTEIFDARTTKTAALGIEGLRLVLLTAYNKVVKNKIMHFNSKEEALEYLVS